MRRTALLHACHTQHHIISCCAFHHFITHIFDAWCSLLHMPGSMHIVSHSRVFRPQSETNHTASSICYPNLQQCMWACLGTSSNRASKPIQGCRCRFSFQSTPARQVSKCLHLAHLETMSSNINVITAHYHTLLLQLARRCLALIHCQAHQT